MLTLRTKIGLTQAGLADFLHVSRRAVVEWEAGSSYPKVEHIKQLIALGIQQRAFPAGEEAAAIRELWQISRQKVLLDEYWLAGLLRPPTGVKTAVNLYAPVPAHNQKPPQNVEQNRVINLPFQPTPFIGRGSELTEISRLLRDPACRLLTLIGPGGMGKTRLAIEAAQGQTNEFRDGVVFVPLASIGAPNQIGLAIAEALHLTLNDSRNQTAALLAYLRERHMLLVLDNFEHLLDGADLVSEILQHALNITVVVTSRERLDLRSEWLFDVEGLSYPTDYFDGSVLPTMAQMTDYSAVQLFTRQVTQMQAGTPLSEANLSSIISICQQVAGMPLAIELAAAGVRTQPIEEIEQQIRTNLDVLTTTYRDIPARHRSLRAVFDHSWYLLLEPESVLLSRLGVFRGSFTADAAAYVADAAVSSLMALVDKSLLRLVSPQNADDAPRFFLLEPIREYALEKLGIRGELDSRQRIHAAYYLELANRATERWKIEGIDSAMEDIDHELDNVRAALQWASESDVRLGIQLAGILVRYWRSHVYFTEGRMWLKNLLALDEHNHDPAAIRARLPAVNGAGWIALDQYDFEDAAHYFEQGRMLRRALGEPEDDTNILANAGLQARAAGHYEQAKRVLEDMLSRHRALNDRGTLSTGGLGFSLYVLALVLREQGDYAGATKLLEECIEHHRSLNDREAVSQGTLGLSDVARDQGDVANVRAYVEQCLTTFREVGTLWAVGFSLNNLAQAAYLEGDLPQALNLVNESIKLFRSQHTDGSMTEVLVTLGYILYAMGDLTGAQEALTESLQLALTAGPRLMVAADLEALASVMTAAGKPVLAVQLLAAASELRLQMGTPIRPADRANLNAVQQMLQTTLGADSFAQVWAEAAKRPLEAVIGEMPFNEVLSAQITVPQSEDIAAIIITHPNEGGAAADVSVPTGRRIDWGNALVVPNFYGREWELALLKEWVIEERCQVVSVLGMGGMGKSALTVRLMHQVAEHFEVIIWRSLRDLPTCEILLEDLLQVLAPETFREAKLTFERKMSILLDQMRAVRTLIVLDNLETVLEEGEGQGRIRPGYEGFAQFLRLSAETKHQSCVMLTSREKPAALVALEGSRSTVRVLRLARLDNEACERLLAEKDVIGTAQECERLIEAYTGNPLALKIVAQTIVDLFAGAIAPFLEQGEVIFGGVRELLGEQFARLSSLEQSVLLWLAIMREPLTFDEFAQILVTPVPRGRVLEAVESLRRRSLIERGLQPGSFTLQSVVLEYVTSHLIMEIGEEIQANQFSRLIEYGLEVALSREYVRQTQRRVILEPILQFLRTGYPQKNALEERLLTQLREFAAWPEDAQGYAPSNLVALLHLQRGNLRGIDLSGLALRGVYLQGVAMQDSSLQGSIIKDSIFTETFDALTSVAVSPKGTYWAAASRRGEIRIWTSDGQILHRSWQAHVETIPTMTFSSDERILVTGSWDGTFKLWDVGSGRLVWEGAHASLVKCVVFSPQGTVLASSGNDGIVQLWDAKTGARLISMSHTTPVPAVVWSLDGSQIVTGDRDGTIRVWDLQEGKDARVLRTLLGHNNWVDALALSPDGKILCSVGWDGAVRFWEFDTGRLIETHHVHTDWVQSAVWSRDGSTLATCSHDSTVCMWRASQDGYQTVLLRHTANVVRIAFTPDGQKLITASEDGTLRVWDVANGYCIRIIQGYADSVYAIDWSSDGTHLVCGGTDTFVTIYTVTGDEPQRVLHGHIGSVFGVGWSADGRWLASSGWNTSIHIWDTTLKMEGRLLRHPDDIGNIFYSLAWSPDGAKLACGTNRRGVYIFDMQDQDRHWSGDETPVWIRQVDWHPDGSRIGGGGEDGIVYIWDAVSGGLVHTMVGHQNMITSIAWSPDGTHLASGGKGGNVGEFFLWNPQDGTLVHHFDRHPGIVYSLAWSQSSDVLVSGSSDGMLCWWDVRTGESIRRIEAHQGMIHNLRRSPDGGTLASCGGDGAIHLWNLETGEHLRTLRRDRPYERLNITGIRGLSDLQKMMLRTLGAVED